MLNLWPTLISLCCSFQDTPNDEYTLKNYYYPLNISDDHDDSESILNKKKNATKRSNNIDVFFEIVKKKKRSVNSSSVAIATDGGLSYISSNEGDSVNASHLIKIDVYDMKNLKEVSPLDYWKHADLRLKYYVKTDGDKHYQNIRDIIFNVTKQIAGKKDCKKYFVDNNKKQ